jgi:hypothetical protein
MVAVMNNLKLTVIFLILIFGSFGKTTLAHCDSMEGPVIKASQKALDSGNINYVLIWVRAEDEPIIKEMFSRVSKVRSLGPEARELADMYFFETVVRIHRMGEGEPYTGIKPAGFQPAEGIEAADAAIKSNSLSEILTLIPGERQTEVKKYFTDLRSKSEYDVNDLTAGRKYVAAYVHFIHFVEGLIGDAEHTPHNNYDHMN